MCPSSNPFLKIGTQVHHNLKLHSKTKTLSNQPTAASTTVSVCWLVTYCLSLHYAFSMCDGHNSFKSISYFHNLTAITVYCIDYVLMLEII